MIDSLAGASSRSPFSHFRRMGSQNQTRLACRKASVVDLDFCLPLRKFG